MRRVWAPRQGEAPGAPLKTDGSIAAPTPTTPGRYFFRDFSAIRPIIFSKLRRLFGPPGSPAGLLLPESLTYDDWRRIGDDLRGIESGVLWWIGDWLRYGERVHGEM